MLLYANVDLASHSLCFVLSPWMLGCILKNRFKFCGDYLTKDKMKQYCDQEWTQYNLHDGE